MTANSKKIGSLLIALGMTFFLCISCICTAASAKSSGLLTIVCENDGTPIKGIKLKVFRIGSFDGEKIILEDDFAAFPVDMTDISTSGLADSASTLREFAFTFKLKPIGSGKTKKNGTLEVKFDKVGVYLIAAENYTDNGRSYITAPAIVMLDPDNEPEKTVYPKIKVKTVMTGTKENYELIKVWENDENLPTKPTQIIVDIYRDFKYFDTIILSEENNWRYSWTYNTGYEWSMIERKIPEGCCVVYRKDGRSYVVENTYVPDFHFEWEMNFPPPETETTTTTTATSTSAATSTVTSAVSTESAETSTAASETSTESTTTTVTTTVKTTIPKTTTTNKLPQTGQLWWPVPIMAVGGLVLIAAGAKIISGSKRDEDE